MPTYNYYCNDCEQPAEVVKGMLEPHPDCPNCGAKFDDGFHIDFSQLRFNIVIKGEPRTVGEQSDANIKRVGKSKIEEMAHKSKERVEQYKKERGEYQGPLPEGASLTKKRVKAETPPWREEGSKPLDINTVKDVDKYIKTGEKD